MRLTFADVQRNVAEVANRQDYSMDVLFELMAAYGRSASSITKLRNGVINLAEVKESTVLQRGVVYFNHVSSSESLPAEVEKLEQDPLTARYNPRYIIATDLKSIAAKDTKKGSTLEIKLQDIDRNVDFFYGWTGDEITDEKTEAVADRRAADKMKELYYEIERINHHKLTGKENTFKHDLNVFFTRLLFCFFAEDTKVFSKENTNIFTGAVKDYTQTDGSDLDQFLKTLFNALDSEDKSGFTSPYSSFPYVNGTLFDTERNIAIPKFNAQARKYILDCGLLNWSEINPDIFGSMFQSIVDEGHRASHGQHYTSVPNIMKTIEPLFLDELRGEFDKNFDNKNKLQKLHDRISKIKVFDPACGSGNFLIIAYKELRKLEHAIIDRQYDNEYKRAILAGKLTSKIDLNNFYGIEIDDFACEVAVLSLYLAKHQMNIEFEKQFGKEIILIPLKDKANVVKGNAARLDWQKVCPNKQHTKNEPRYEQSKLIDDVQEQSELFDPGILNLKSWDEIYLISNPPYLGGKSIKDVSQKEDVKIAHHDMQYSKNVDYISIWFIKGAEYIKGTNARLAFVSTNSVVQGEQVAMIWPYVFSQDLEIAFAHTSFKWTNNARGSAGVTCVIIGLACMGKVKNKYLYAGGVAKKADHINAYLSDSKSNIIIEKRSTSISNLPKLILGSMPKDCGHLMLSPIEKDQLLVESPWASKFIKRFMGSADLIKGQERYCLWIKSSDQNEAMKSKFISNRVQKVKEFRLNSEAASTRDFARIPYRFAQAAHKDSGAIIIPLVSSESREYIPIGIVDKNTVISSLAFALYDAEPWLFSVLNSKMCMVWVAAVGGKMETRYRFSAAIVYNNFPIVDFNEQKKSELNASARNILFARENHSERTLAELYSPMKMPEDLRVAHHQNDLLVDRLYRQKPYESDEERLADLFTLYEQMTAKEKLS